MHMNQPNRWGLLSFAMILLAGMAAGCSILRPAVPTAKTAAYADATPEAIAAITDRVFPTVVMLDVAQVVYADGKRQVRRGLGSGVIIDDQGHVLTNYHVAGRAAEIHITLANKERVPARLIGDDHWTDVAVVQIDLADLKKRSISFKHAELGNSASLVVGQPVVAIGTPFGLARTMTQGIVSNTDRTFYPQRQTIDEYETGAFSNWIQMDTPIAPGNSGGPLVDMNARVVGINTRGIAGQGLNFAIPIDTVKEVADKILASATDERKGKVDRSYLGMDLKPLQDLESFYAIDINTGVLVNSVDRNSPAAKAGVRAQDILLELNGKPVNVRFPEEVAAARKVIADLPLGTPVTMTLKRGRENVTVNTQVARLEGAVGEEREYKVWGLATRDVTLTYANDRQLDDDAGVVVTTMSPGQPAAKAELAAGDVIRAVNRKPVTDIDAFSRLYDESVKRKDKTVLLDIQRGRGGRTIVLKINQTDTAPAASGPATTRP